MQQQRYCDEVHERVARSAPWLDIEDKCESNSFLQFVALKKNKFRSAPWLDIEDKCESKQFSAVCSLKKEQIRVSPMAGH